MALKTAALADFKDAFPEAAPDGYSFAPGRINLIGEHVDYMGGMVLPAAVKQGTFIYFKSHPTPAGGEAVLRVRCGGSTVPFSLTSIDTNADAAEFQGWKAYVRGATVKALKLAERSADDSTIRSVDISINGDLPQGAGVSSSAALSVALINALFQVFSGRNANEVGDEMKLEVAKAARMVEVEYCNVNIGIMDQCASVFGAEGSYLELDCASLVHKVHRFPAAIGSDGQYMLLLVNSMVKHKLGDQYNVIRRDIEGGLAKLTAAVSADSAETGCELASSVTLPDVASSPSAFGISSELDGEGICAGKDMSADEAARTSYVIDEVRRTKAFITTCQALSSAGAASAEADAGVAKLGALLTQTHRGMADKLKVSTPHIELIHRVATGTDGVLGGRLMGGGFGGCVLLLCRRDARDAIVRTVGDAFKAEFPDESVCEAYNVEVGCGAHTGAQ